MSKISSRKSPAARQNRAILAAAVVLSTVVAACGHKSPEQELVDQAAPVSAWIAALQMAGEKWTANSVPASFVETTSKDAGQDLDGAAGEAAKSRARPEVREPLRQAISEAADAGKRLRRAAAAGDRPEAARQAARLAALHQRLEAWKKSVSPS